MILFNAANLSSGGGLTILRQFYKYAPQDSLFLIANENVAALLVRERADGPESLVIPKWAAKPWGGLYFYNNWLKKIFEEKKADFLFSLGNIGARGVEKQIVYIQWAYYAYGVNAGGRADFRSLLRRIIRYSLIAYFSKCASLWIVQTEAMKRQLLSRFPKARIHVSYPGHDNPSVMEVDARTPEGEKGQVELIYPSLYYSHKNFELLRELALRVEQRGLPYKFSLTLPNEKYRELGFGRFNCVRNLGVLSKQDLALEYQRHHALIMPTKLETVGLPYLEAMSMGLPILTSDKDFSRDICGSYAIYFDPECPDDAMKALSDLQRQFFEKRNFREESRQQLVKFPSWRASVENALKMCV